MKKLIYIIGLLLISLTFLSCGKTPKIFQGTVTAYDSSSKILAVKNEKSPYDELSFSLHDADVGGEPAIGDLVRLSYLEEAGKLAVLRVMNLGHQSELKKK
jgi:hypothetical protein